ncbi:MFS transporter [Gordonia sp. SID5947]|uniref:MFS transporter n=1 Tax=Gordonia sp. SID5947 TaxID=2690315 RepID=UPI0013693A93|nr:MFS transporter [Gordonia sp. SID5947]MYR07921.1 MFS transporter [Gordonia sp. SID5947]
MVHSGGTSTDSSVPYDGNTSVPQIGAPNEVSKSFISLYTLAALAAVTAVNTPIYITLALRVGDVAPDGKTTTFSLLSGLGMLCATFCTPLFGALSDRTRSRFGRRAPWIALGLVGTVIGAVIMGAADSLFGLVVGWLLLSSFSPATVSPLFAVVTDRVPEHQQGLLSGFAGASNMLAMVVGSIIVAMVPHSGFLQVVAPAIFAVVVVTAFLLAFPDRSVPKQATEPARSWSVRGVISKLYFNPKDSPDLSWLLLCLFILTLGNAFGSTYTVYFAEFHLGVGPDDIATVVALSMSAACLPSLLFSPLAGWLADRTGRHRPILISGIIISAIGMLLVVATRDLSVYYLGSVVNGIGFSITAGITLAYTIATISDRDNGGRDIGFMNISLSLPLTLAPFIAPLFLYMGSTSGENYVNLYIAGAILTLAATPITFLIRRT